MPIHCLKQILDFHLEMFDHLDSLPPQAVLKVLARLKYSVQLYKAKSGFSILTEECLTFQTVSPTTKDTMPPVFHTLLAIVHRPHSYLHKTQFVQKSMALSGQITE